MLSSHTASFKCLYFDVYIRLVSSQHQRYYDDVSMNVAGRQRLNQVCHVRHGALNTVAQCTAAHLSVVCCRCSWCCNLACTLWQGLKGNGQSNSHKWLAKWTPQSCRPPSVGRSRVNIMMCRFHNENTVSDYRSCCKTINNISITENFIRYKQLNFTPIITTSFAHCAAND